MIQGDNQSSHLYAVVLTRGYSALWERQTDRQSSAYLSARGYRGTKPVSIPFPPASPKFPQHCLWNICGPGLSDDSLSLLNAALLHLSSLDDQVVSSVMSMALTVWANESFTFTDSRGWKKWFEESLWALGGEGGGGACSPPPPFLIQNIIVMINNHSMLQTL